MGAAKATNPQSSWCVEEFGARATIVQDFYLSCVISSNRAVVPIYPCMPQHNRRVGARELAGWSVGLQIDTVTDHSLMVCVAYLESMTFAPCCQWQKT
jgi:hypothetical protein